MKLLQAIDACVSEKLVSTSDAPVYWNYLPIVQSSGTGKSRMVDEMSKLVFTIPFNFRETTISGKLTDCEFCASGLLTELYRVSARRPSLETIHGDGGDLC